MRVAITGATGNVGTAILKVLAQTPEVTSVVGIARRMPDTSVSPYSACEWKSIDIAAASSESVAVEQLAEVLAGVDAVIHLAWLIQPNSDRDLLRRVNVEGTRRVTEAAAQANVAHLVVASSVGAYSSDDSLERRAEAWPTTGISTSHYSVDKAAQEDVLDRFSAAHPDITVTRLRPALIFGADAASEIQRYFLASWMPLQLLRSGSLPFLPVPKDLRGVQAVHSSDVARAYVASVLHRIPGAFNICADDVLGAQELADLLDHGRFVKLPTRVVRAALGVGHGMKLVAADEGWLDMGMAVPLMDNSRAKEELGWRPEYSAIEAVRDLLQGMADGQGGESDPLRPRDLDLPRPLLRQATNGTRPSRVSDDETSGAETPEREARDLEAPELDKELLGLYLSDHLTGATAGAKRIERMAADFADTPVYAALAELADQIRGERAFIERLIEHLQTKRRPIAEVISWTGERVGRLKGNGAMLNRSPMTMVLEAELMRSAIAGKMGMWQTLEANADLLGLEDSQFAELTQHALHQLSVLDAVHEYARNRAFRDDLEVYDNDSDLSPVRPD